MTSDGAEKRLPIVLVIDDEPSILRLVRLQLSGLDARVELCEGGVDGLKAFDDLAPALVVVDMLMPSLSGFDVLRHVRARSTTPVIVMTAAASEDARLEAMELGATDFVVKPFGANRLQSAIQALLEVGSTEPRLDRVKLGGLEIDPGAEVVYRNGASLALSRSEWLLMKALLSKRGKTWLNQELLTEVWGPEYRDDVAYLRVWISRLQQKLGPEGKSIVGRLGIGYAVADWAE